MLKPKKLRRKTKTKNTDSLNLTEVFQGQRQKQPHGRQKPPSHTSQYKTLWGELGELSAYEINPRNVNIFIGNSSTTSSLQPTRPNSAAATTGPNYLILWEIVLWEIVQVSFLKNSLQKR